LSNVPWKPCIRCSLVFIPSKKHQRVCDICVCKCSGCGREIQKAGNSHRRLRKCDGCRQHGIPLSELKFVNREAYERELARLRNKNTLRYRVAHRFTDISTSDELTIRRRARTCAICRCRLGEQRHIDHIIPIELGGTHTRDNVRVTCPTCNMSRSRTYDDIGNFQMNLWMGTDAAENRVAVHANRGRRVSRTCSSCGAVDSVPEHRVWKKHMLCFECKPKGKREPHSTYRRAKKMSYDGKYDIALIAALNQQGFGYKRIASHLGIERSAVRSVLKRAIEIGLVER
jgi:hypothetical protein